MTRRTARSATPSRHANKTLRLLAAPVQATEHQSSWAWSAVPTSCFTYMHCISGLRELYGTSQQASVL